MSSSVPPVKVTGDRFEGRLDVHRPLSHETAHSEITSASTRSATSGLRLFAGTMSTAVPRIRSASLRICPRPKSPTLGTTSTSRSMSLSRPSLPRATLPNSRTLLAPRFLKARNSLLALVSTEVLRSDLGADGTSWRLRSNPAAATSSRHAGYGRPTPHQNPTGAGLNKVTGKPWATSPVS